MAAISVPTKAPTKPTPKPAQVSESVTSDSYLQRGRQLLENLRELLVLYLDEKEKLVLTRKARAEGGAQNEQEDTEIATWLD